LHVAFGLSTTISSQFTYEVCTAAENRQKITKTPYYGNSRLFKLINVDTSKKLVSSSFYSTQQVYICNRIYARRAKSGKMTSAGTAFLFPRAQAS